MSADDNMLSTGLGLTWFGKTLFAAPGDCSVSQCEVKRSIALGPPGPTSLKSLFEWADYNAHTLCLDGTELSAATADRFKDFAQMCKIEIHEAFAGTCNGSVALKQQFAAMTDVAGSTVVYLHQLCDSRFFLYYTTTLDTNVQ